MMVNARVHSFLENGLMLSFLTYFSGTVSYFSQTRLIFLALQECLYFISVCSFYCQVDIFNLLNSFPSGNWKDDYSKNKKVFTIFLFFVDNCCVCAWHLHFCNISYCVLFFFLQYCLSGVIF
jgi:rRNA biogenesis protein RRP5